MEGGAFLCGGLVDQGEDQEGEEMDHGAEVICFFVGGGRGEGFNYTTRGLDRCCLGVPRCVNRGARVGWWCYLGEFAMMAVLVGRRTYQRLAKFE